MKTLAYIGHKEPEEYNEAFESGMKYLGFKVSKPPEIPKKNFAKLDEVIDSLQKLEAGEKRRLLEACLMTMANDKVITVYESELFRAIADALRVNIPLILPGTIGNLRP